MRSRFRASSTLLRLPVQMSISPPLHISDYCLAPVTPCLPWFPILFADVEILCQLYQKPHRCLGPIGAFLQYDVALK